jgi:hypothetical protein
VQLIATFCLILAYAMGFGLVVFIVTFWTWQWLRVALSTGAVVMQLGMTFFSYYPSVSGVLQGLVRFFTNAFVLGVLACWFVFVWLYFRRKKTSPAERGDKE